ncbi:MAG: hypothetical protein ACK42C_02415 [Aquificaceae bacterium]|uniref:hypothetical protein n=1 Tax=Hydrogenobacter sp. Uz 6-8 TaxID=3384828 RepID=UPI0030984519
MRKLVMSSILLVMSVPSPYTREAHTQGSGDYRSSQGMMMHMMDDPEMQRMMMEHMHRCSEQMMEMMMKSPSSMERMMKMMLQHRETMRKVFENNPDMKRRMEEFLK